MRLKQTAALLLAAIVATGAGILLAQTADAAWASPGSLPSGSGRIWSIAVDPGNVNTLIAGTDHGVAESLDAGVTWKNTNLSGVRVWVVGFDLRAPHTAFAGTNGRGVYTSADGSSWSSASTGLANNNVRSLAFSLSGVAAGTDNGVFFDSAGKWGAIGLADPGVDVGGIGELTIAGSVGRYRQRHRVERLCLCQ